MVGPNKTFTKSTCDVRTVPNYKYLFTSSLIQQRETL